MPKIRVYANYEFTNDSDNCNDNGKLSMLYEVPKSWMKWNEEKRQAWLEKTAIKQIKHLMMLWLFIMLVNSMMRLNKKRN